MGNRCSPVEGLVSVIIPSYNAREWVGRAIDSVLAQTYRSFEIIVVDDGSTDGTSEYIKAAYPDVILHIQENGGQSPARNAGARLAKGEYLAFLDADDLWLPRKLELQLAAVQDINGWGLCGTRRFKFHAGQKIVYPRIANKRPRAILVDHLKLFEHNALLTSSVLVRREAFAESGGFDEGLRRVADWDLWLRISKNWRVVVVDAPLMGYQKTPGSLSSDQVVGQYAVLKILEKWSSQYPHYIAHHTRRAKESLVRRLLRAGRIEEARQCFFDEGLAKRNWNGRIRFALMSVIWPLHGRARKRWPDL